MASSSAPNTKSSSCFRWENQPGKLMKSFKSLRSNGRFTDVTLAADGKYLSAHRVILSAYSSYFEELLSLHMERQTIVFLQDVAFDVLQMLVDFMYNGEIEVECGKIVSFFDTAQTLKIRDLMHRQVPVGTNPRVSLQIPNRQRKAECPAQASRQESHQASASSDGIVHLLQEHNKLPSGDNAVDINSLSQSSAGERIQTEDSDSVFEFVRLQYEGSDSEDNSIVVNNEEILAPRHELYHLEDVLVSAVASNESGEAQSSSKQVPKSFEVQDFNRVPSSIAINFPSSALDLPKLVAKSHRKYTRLSRIHSAFTKIPSVSRLSRIRRSAFANNSPSSSTLELPKLVAKSCRKRTGLSRMHRLCSEKQFKAQRKRNVLKVPPGMGTKDNTADLGGDTNDETSSATSQYEQIEAPELPGTLFEGSGTTGNEANDLEPTGPSGIANQTPGQGTSNASSRFGLRKRTSAVILEPSNTGSLPGTSRSESSTPERFASSSASSSAQSDNNKPTSPTTPHDRTQNFVCQRCSKGCTSQGVLLAHQRLYCGEEPSFECVTSNKRFYTKNTNRDRVHNSTEFVCHRCSKSYKWPSNLMRHECWECGKEPTFACVTCDKRFHFKDSLKKHCARVHKSCDI